MLVPYLRISNGTDSINLLSKKRGFMLRHWEPQVAQLKSSATVWRDSPFADNKTLEAYKYDNVVETFTLVLRADSQDRLAYYLNKLRKLLNNGRDFWVNKWQEAPSWLKVRGTAESEVRYAMIHDWSTPADVNLYSPKTIRCGTVFEAEFVLTIERGHYMNTEPVYEWEDPKSSNFKKDVAEWDYIVNHHVVNPLTHIFYFDGTATWSLNLIDVDPPYYLLPATLDNTDAAVYFGMVSVANGAPFFSGLRFDLSQGILGTVDGVWEYYDDDTSSWQSFSATTWDETYGLTNDSQPTAFMFEQTYPAGDWGDPDVNFGYTTVNSVSGYWIRYRLSVAGTYTQRPIQQNTHVQNITTPYIEYNDHDVPGDIPARAQYIVKSCLSNDFSANKALMGLRRGDRGAYADYFSAYLNFSDQNNPSLISAGENNAYSAFTTTKCAPAGRSIVINTSSHEFSMENVGYISISRAATASFYGQFHVMLRVWKNVTAPADLEFALFFGPSLYGSSYNTPQIAITRNVKSLKSSTANCLDIFDFGLVNLMPSTYMRPVDYYSHMYISALMTYPSGYTDKIYLCDLIMIPADEWYTNVYQSAESGAYFNTMVRRDYLNIDSVSDQRVGLRTSIGDQSDWVISPLSHRSTGNAMLWPLRNQKLWFNLGSDLGTGQIPHVPHTGLLAHIGALRASQYLGMRGDDIYRIEVEYGEVYDADPPSYRGSYPTPPPYR